MRSSLFAILFLLGLVCTANAGDYTYISANEMKAALEADRAMIIIDIQVEEDFRKHHLPGSIATYAYPVKTEAEEARIDQAIEQYKATGNDIVIVCPRGKGGAKRCYDYLLKQQVPAQKITILEKGIAGWPFPELVEKG